MQQRSHIKNSWKFWIFVICMVCLGALNLSVTPAFAEFNLEFAPQYNWRVDNYRKGVYKTNSQSLNFSYTVTKLGEQEDDVTELNLHKDKKNFTINFIYIPSDQENVSLKSTPYSRLNGTTVTTVGLKQGFKVETFAIVPMITVGPNDDDDKKFYVKFKFGAGLAYNRLKNLSQEFNIKKTDLPNSDTRCIVSGSIICDGVTFSDVNGTTTAPTAKDQLGLAIVGGGSLGYKITENLALELGFRFNSFGKISTSWHGTVDGIDLDQSIDENYAFTNFFIGFVNRF